MTPTLGLTRVRLSCFLGTQPLGNLRISVHGAADGGRGHGGLCLPNQDQEGLRPWESGSGVNARLRTLELETRSLTATPLTLWLSRLSGIF